MVINRRSGIANAFSSNWTDTWIGRTTGWCGSSIDSDLLNLETALTGERGLTIDDCKGLGKSISANAWAWGTVVFKLAVNGLALGKCNTHEFSELWLNLEGISRRANTFSIHNRTAVRTALFIRSSWNSREFNQTIGG